MDKERLAQIEIGRKTNAMYIAMVIREAMGLFHSKHLTDTQMKELNPIIRNAVYTALYALEHQNVSKMADFFVEYHLSKVPSYWEEPKTIVDFVV